MREPPLKKSLYWCPECNVPLIGASCGCGAKGFEMPLLKPYDIRPALSYDRGLIKELISERFGDYEPPKVILFNKTGGEDRNDLVIANGIRFGQLSFSPVTGEFTFEPSFECLSYILPYVTKNIVDITKYMQENPGKRLGGKKIDIVSDVSPGAVIIKAGRKHGVGFYEGGSLKIKKIGVVEEKEAPDPGYENVIRCNKKHLKNNERHAVRFIKSEVSAYAGRGFCANASFSGGKDSTVVLELAKKAGVSESYFVDTGMEFPQTLEFVESMNIGRTLGGGDFKAGLKSCGIPKKDNRWCCERLKLLPVSRWLEKTGPCVTVQGNRWYESFARSGLPAAAKNPYDNRQVNLSPIRGWRALEVFLYVWWRDLPLNPLYDMGFERVGCWMCPAMLESEAKRAKELLPENYSRWEGYLFSWAKKCGLPREYVTFGLWRWDELPPKMREIAGKFNLIRSDLKKRN